MGDDKKHDPLLSTKLRIAGNLAGAIYTVYERDGRPDLAMVAREAARLTQLIVEAVTRE